MKSVRLARFFARAAAYFGDASVPRPGEGPAGNGDGADANGGNSRRRPASRRLATRESFESRLQAFRERQGGATLNLVTGNVQLLGLSEVRAFFGADWAEIRETAYRIAEHCIENHTTADDLYVRVREESYIILFGRLSREEAERTGRAIAADISRALVGGMPGGAKVTVRTITLEVETEKPVAGLDDLLTRIGTAEARQEAMEKRRFESVSADYAYGYLPTVSLTRGLVSIYQFMPIAERGQRPAPTPSDDGVGRFACDLDRYVLTLVRDALERAPPDRRGVILVPLHYETLSYRMFCQSYVETCRTLPPSSRRRLMFHLRGVPSGLPAARLLEVATTVAPFGLGHVVQLGLKERSLDRFLGRPFLAVSVDAGGWGAPTQDRILSMREFARAARKMRVRTLLARAQTVLVAAAAVKAGFDYVNGEAVVRIVDDPGRVYVVKEALDRLHH